MVAEDRRRNSCRGVGSGVLEQVAVAVLRERGRGVTESSRDQQRQLAGRDQVGDVVVAQIVKADPRDSDTSDAAVEHVHDGRRVDGGAVGLREDEVALDRTWTGEQLGGPAIYVGLTRGRHTNHAYVVTNPGEQPLEALQTHLANSWADRPATEIEREIEGDTLARTQRVTSRGLSLQPT